jgi:SAM-dependent methyltransferase
VNTFRRLTFDLWYLRRPPWDSGVVPPEVEDFIRDNSPGHALDLGCGTGTSSIALARAGWIVTGVDFARRAIRTARQKARRVGLEIDFRVADVLHLPSLPYPYSLVLDIGCFHGLSPSGKTCYLNQLYRLLAPGGIWLIYGFNKPDDSPGSGLILADLESIPLKLKRRQDGVDKRDKPSVWLWFKKEK